MRPILLTFIPLLPFSVAAAQPPGQQVDPVQWLGTFTAVSQSAEKEEAKDELSASFDMFGIIPTATGEWNLHLEGSTTPASDAVAALLPEANADAGTALDRDGRGRLQISELFYTFSGSGAWMSVGVLDAAAFLDQSAVANDETTQFLGTTLVNNPTIAFPDYTLGVAYRREPRQSGPALTLFASGSHGLADNPSARYSDLFDLDDDGKGVFIAAQTDWQAENQIIRLGLWGNLSDHARRDGSPGMEDNFGAYVLVDRAIGAGWLNTRLGLANPEVSQAAAFASLAYELPLGSMKAGLGLSHTWVSSRGQTANEDDRSQAEIYLAYRLTPAITLSPSVQWIRNSEFDASGQNVDPQQLLYGLRLNFTS